MHYEFNLVSQERRSARVPASTWDALISHMRDPADTARLADSAENRLLHRYAIPLYWHAANVDDQHAARQLARLLAEREDLDGLRARADAGDGNAAQALARLLAEHGDLDGLRARADAGDWYAAELAGGPDPWWTYHILRASSDLDEADEESLPLAWTVPLHINLDSLRARADAGEWYAAPELAERLAARGDLDEAEQILRARADAGDRNAARALARLLAEGGDLDGLRALADAGNGYAAWALPGLLAEHGDVNGLRALTDAGDGNAASKLPELLMKLGRYEEAEQLRRFGLNPDGSIASA
jgi:hypothetical protein